MRKAAAMLTAVVDIGDTFVCSELYWPTKNDFHVSCLPSDFLTGFLTSIYSEYFLTIIARYRIAVPTV